MSDEKRACLVYIAATATSVDSVRSRLEGEGYAICVIEAQPDDAVAAQSGERDLPPELLQCIENSDICVFLIPEEPGASGDLCAGIGVANSEGKRTIAVLCGDPKQIPEGVDDLADAVVKIDSDRLIPAVEGEDVWESPSAKPDEPRKTNRVKCQ
ncbi:hypothetical protein [Sphingomonas soli]|uniref:hypothetical protein n=1 Tax=Sphingomonas soli TaxID=266127 RepID=UPI0012EE50EC|nr:hypothetical protein [Sphingomonas soli]